MKDLKRFGERDSMNVDPMNDEGFGDLERERLGEIWRVGRLEDLCKNNRPWQVYINKFGKSEKHDQI